MDPLAQLTAALSGRYAVEHEIGAGGMGTVYLARDLRHDRKVALKVFNADLGAVLGVERFLSEIKVTANLQHPNLLPLFESGQADDLLFYVMPFIEGETLRRRLERERQLPVDEAVRIAVAVANALDYAHARGVIHRDLKPENILLQHGQPIVADFGIALAISNAGGGRITQTGMSVGTPLYMSPEQAAGDRVIDGRADIYSLGAMLYEMLAGQPPHVGGNPQAILARLLMDDVQPVGELRRSVPPHVDTAVRRALEKLPADRFATAKEFGDELVTPRAAHQVVGTSSGAGSPTQSATWMGVAWRSTPWVAAALGIGFGAWMLLQRPASEAQPVHFSVPITSPLTYDAAQSVLAATPDGKRIVFSASIKGRTMLFVRSIDDEEIHPLPGTENADAVFVSADGKSIGFRADGQIKRMPVDGGPVTPITTGAAVSTPAWSSKDVIVFGRGPGSGLFLVPATGGEPTRITKPDSARKELGHGMPAFLPDGEAVVFTIFGATTYLAIATLDGDITRLDSLKGQNPIFVKPDILLYVDNTSGVVHAVPFDPKSRRPTGPPVDVLDGVDLQLPQALLAVSANGKLLARAQEPRTRVTVVGSSGPPQALPGDARRNRQLRVSPDGTRIAVDVAADDGTQDVWIYDLKSAAPRKLTLDGRSMSPVWSSDGKRIAFARREGASINVYEVAADGSDGPRPLVTGPGARWPVSWTADDKTLIYTEVAVGHPARIVEQGEDRKPRVLVEVPSAVVGLAAISPDGRWLAYASSQTQRTEVFVRAMNGEGKWQVSQEGGTQPVWSRDGTTLYYRENGHIVATTVGAGPAFSTVGSRVADNVSSQTVFDYDAMPGKGLAVLVPTGEFAQIRVVVDWIDEVRKKMRK